MKSIQINDNDIVPDNLFELLPNLESVVFINYANPQKLDLRRIKSIHFFNYDDIKIDLSHLDYVQVLDFSKCFNTEIILPKKIGLFMLKFSHQIVLDSINADKVLFVDIKENTINNTKLYINSTTMEIVSSNFDYLLGKFDHETKIEEIILDKGCNYNINNDIKKSLKNVVLISIR